MERGKIDDGVRHSADERFGRETRLAERGSQGRVRDWFRGQGRGEGKIEWW